MSGLLSLADKDAGQRVRSWYGLPAEIAVENNLWHLVWVGGVALNHPPLPAFPLVLAHQAAEHTCGAALLLGTLPSLGGYICCRLAWWLGTCYGATAVCCNGRHPLTLAPWR